MSILEQLINIYAPHTCLGCGLAGSLLCDNCNKSLIRSAECCYQCRQPSRFGRMCSRCRTANGSSLVSVNCLTDYAGLSKDLLWALKFNRAQAAADIIAANLAKIYAPITPKDALIVPIPTAMRRVRKRGYDQAVLIARAYAKRTGCQYAFLLSRHGSQEQKGAGRQQRQLQLQGALRVTSPQEVAQSRIILIDDVVTTGATLEQAASVLKSAGAKAVAALAFARA